MKKHVAVVLSLALIVGLVGYGMAAFAADAPACCSAGAVKVTATGKVEVKGEKDAKTVSLVVSDCKADDGKTSCTKMKDQSITLTGAKVADAEKLAGKNVEIKGTCKGCKELDVTSVTEKK